MIIRSKLLALCLAAGMVAPLTHPTVRHAAARKAMATLHHIARAIDPVPIKSPPCSPSLSGSGGPLTGTLGQLEALNPVQLGVSAPLVLRSPSLPPVPRFAYPRPVRPSEPSGAAGPGLPPLDGGGVPGVPDGPPVTPPVVTPPVAGVPEPGTWALLVAGFGIVGGRMRSRRKMEKV